MKQKIVVVDEKYYTLKGNTPSEILRGMRKFRGYDIEFIGQYDTSRYEFYHFKIREKPEE